MSKGIESSKSVTRSPRNPRIVIRESGRASDPVASDIRKAVIALIAVACLGAVATSITSGKSPDDKNDAFFPNLPSVPPQQQLSPYERIKKECTRGQVRARNGNFECITPGKLNPTLIKTD